MSQSRMTKRERKYQRRLFAELHLNKTEQQKLIALDASFYEMYVQYKDTNTTGIPVWLATVRMSAFTKALNKIAVPMLELAGSLRAASAALNNYKIAVS